MVTSPKLMAPFHMDLGMILSSRGAIPRSHAAETRFYALARTCGWASERSVVVRLGLLLAEPQERAEDPQCPAGHADDRSERHARSQVAGCEPRFDRVARRVRDPRETQLRDQLRRGEQLRDLLR